MTTVKRKKTRKNWHYSTPQKREQLTEIASFAILVLVLFVSGLNLESLGL